MCPKHSDAAKDKPVNHTSVCIYNNLQNITRFSQDYTPNQDVIKTCYCGHLWIMDPLRTLCYVWSCSHYYFLSIGVHIIEFHGDVLNQLYVLSNLLLAKPHCTNHNHQQWAQDTGSWKQTQRQTESTPEIHLQLILCSLAGCFFQSLG